MAESKVLPSIRLPLTSNDAICWSCIMQGWLGSRDTILHAGEGPVQAVQWAGSLVAWANNVGVKVLSLTSLAPEPHDDLCMGPAYLSGRHMISAVKASRCQRTTCADCCNTRSGSPSMRFSCTVGMTPDCSSWGHYNNSYTCLSSQLNFAAAKSTPMADISTSRTAVYSADFPGIQLNVCDGSWTMDGCGYS